MLYSVVMFRRLVARALKFNRLRAIWPKATSAEAYVESPERQLLQNKQCEKCEKATSKQECENQVVEQWTGNPKAADLIPAGRKLFRIACFEVVAVLVTLPRLPRW